MRSDGHPAATDNASLLHPRLSILPSMSKHLGIGRPVRGTNYLRPLSDADLLASALLRDQSGQGRHPRQSSGAYAQVFDPQQMQTFKEAFNVCLLVVGVPVPFRLRPGLRVDIVRGGAEGERGC